MPRRKSEPIGIIAPTPTPRLLLLTFDDEVVSPSFSESSANSMNLGFGHAFALLADVHSRSQPWLNGAFLFYKAASLAYAPERRETKAKECLQSAGVRRRKRRVS